jgi:hypothetical protein
MALRKRVACEHDSNIRVRKQRVPVDTAPAMAPAMAILASLGMPGNLSCCGGGAVAVARLSDLAPADATKLAAATACIHQHAQSTASALKAMAGPRWGGIRICLLVTCVLYM